MKQAFDAMRAECRAAGLPGLYLVACVCDAGQARQAAAEGYDAVTAYNWPGLGLEAGQNAAPVRAAAGRLPAATGSICWSRARSRCCLPLCGGWDSRPWHGDNNLVRFGRTPELFERHLQDARRMLDAQPPHPRLLKAVLVEAWNEWGEGSYIEPHQEYGFGYLDAIRQVFGDAPGPHTDLTPADVGLGPYDLPRQAAFPTAWRFRDGIQGWSQTMQTTEPVVADGALTARTTGTDPAFFSPPLQARARQFTAVLVRMKLEPADGRTAQDSAQLFCARANSQKAKRRVGISPCWPMASGTTIACPSPAIRAGAA